MIEAIEAIGQEVDPDVDIVTVKMAGSSKAPVVRVYIDYPGGVTFDVLAETQRWIGEVLDEIDPFPGAYTLEVSSPGPDRPLRKLSHFENAVEKNVHLNTSEAVDGRRAFTGVLDKVDGNNLEITVDGKDKFVIPFNLIIAGNVKDN